MLYDAKKVSWQKATWEDEKGEHPCLFYDMRIDPNTVPEGKFMYQVRDDGCSGDWCQIKEKIMINFWGTILTDEPIDFDSYPDKFIEVKDYSYEDEYIPVTLEHSIIEIFEEDKEKKIRYIGYGYCAGSSVTEKPEEICRFISYENKNIYLLSDVLNYSDGNKKGFSAFEADCMCNAKQTIEDLFEENLFEKYSEIPFFIQEEKLSEQLTCGTYLVL